MDESALGTLRFSSMGTTVEVHAQAAELETAGVVVQSLFHAWDDALTRFRPQSELSQLNRSAGQRFVASDLLFKAVATALHWAEATGGTFDPTLLYQIERLGYRETFEAILQAKLPPLGEPIRPGGDWRSVRIEPQWRTIALPEGVGLDLGGVAKGMAVDAALDALQEDGIFTALVNAGGDLAVRGLPQGADAWPIGMAGLPGEVIPLQRGAVATSGIERRRWLQGGAQRHHLLDPATGYPAETGLRTVTVVAGSCAEADVAATTAFLRGSAAGAEFLRQRGLSGLMVTGRGDVLRIGRWPGASEVN